MCGGEGGARGRESHLSLFLTFPSPSSRAWLARWAGGSTGEGGKQRGPEGRFILSSRLLSPLSSTTWSVQWETGGCSGSRLRLLGGRREHTKKWVEDGHKENARGGREGSGDEGRPKGEREGGKAEGGGGRGFLLSLFFSCSPSQPSLWGLTLVPSPPPPTPFRETTVRRGWSGWSTLCGQG